MGAGGGGREGLLPRRDSRFWRYLLGHWWLDLLIGLLSLATGLGLLVTKGLHFQTAAYLVLGGVFTLLAPVAYRQSGS